MGKVLRYIRRYWFFVALSILCAAITVALTLYVPILTGDAIDYIIDKGLVNFDPVLSIVKKIVVVVLLTAVSQWMMNVSNNRIAYHVIHDIRREAFHKIEILPLKYIDGHSYGEVVSRVIADVDQFSDGLLMGFTQLFTGVITILGTLLFMISLNGKITLVVVLVTVQSQVEGVLTHDSDGSHGNLDTTAAVVGVHYHQIGRDFVPGNDVAVGHPGQHPNLAATLQSTGSLVGHASPQQVIGELEGIAVLHDLVAVTDDTQGGAVGAAGVHFVPCDQGAILGVDVLLDDLPIQASVDQGISGGGSLLDFRTQAMPGLFTDIEHGFNISGHNCTS